MRLVVKNKVMSLKQNSVVTDENNKVVYKVKGSFFANKFLKTYKKVIKDENGKKLFFVRNKFWHKPMYKSAIIYNAKKQKLVVVTNSHITKNGYEAEGATKPITIQGTGWNLDIMLGGEQIGHISLPSNLGIDDTYILDVFNEEDVGFLVALMIAIDNIHDQLRKH